MFEVRSKVHGTLTLEGVGASFRHGKVRTLSEEDLQDPEVKRALLDRRLEIVREVRSRVAQHTTTPVFTEKDWKRLSDLFLRAANRVSDDLTTAIRDEGKALRKALQSRPPSPQGSAPPDSVPTAQLAHREARRRQREESVYVVTPEKDNVSARVNAKSTSEDSSDLLSGLKALKDLREGEEDGG